jgi:hypothetical protein
VGPRAVLDAVKRKIPSPRRESNPRYNDMREIHAMKEANVLFVLFTPLKIANSLLRSKVKGKGKVSLCLTKYHAMKTYWEGGGIVPRIHNFGTIKVTCC